jgi:hypothetical protein
MLKLVDALFGCPHKHRTFPRTATKRGPVRSAANSSITTYVVCLDCGKEFPYDWEQMKVVTTARQVRRAVA